MTLAAGERLGSFEIVGALGAGGMGEVYRARDSRLGRHVALKMLPEIYAADAGRRARLMREAQVLASLNHPNVSTLHGVEEWHGRFVLVLELVEGETVGARLSRAAGPLPLREILPLARQIIDALDAAHDRGIVHRDLKPDNIAVRPDGTVKVLDFGVAKVLTALADDDDPASTITEVLPGAGRATVGTPAYMSPEQIRGEPVTPSTDVWAFGCVLYTMLTGRRAFAGDTRRETLARVLEDEPDFTQLPREVPVLIARLVRRCLEKEPRARLRHIADARAYLEDSGTTQSGQFAVTRRTRVRSGLWAVPAGLGGLIAGALAVWSLIPETVPRITRTVVLTEAPAVLSITPDKSVAISRDGSRVAYVGGNGTGIYLRPLDALTPSPLVTVTPGVELRGLAISPDDRWLAYIENSFILKKIALTGGPSTALARVDAPYRGGTWDYAGGLIFATNSTTKGLLRVPADGGDVSVLTRPARDRGEATHVWPSMLPDGKRVLFTIMPASGDADFNDAQLALFDLSSGTTKTLLRGARSGWYVSSGHLVFAAGRELRAIAFDLERGEVRGTAVSILPQLVGDNIGGANFSVSDEGTLVYPAPVPNNRQMVWVDRQGKETPIPGLSRMIGHPRISPDDAGRLAFSTFRDLFVWEPPGAPVQLTFSPFASWLPLWHPDRRRLVFSSWRGGNGVSNIYVQAAEGAGSVQRLTESPHMNLPSSITPDGAAVLFTVFGPPTGPDIRLVRLASSSKPGEGEAVLDTPRHERNGVVSPDGKWLAYESDTPGTPGQIDVHVRRFPVQKDGTVWQVSNGGGTHPLWSRASSELFYVAGDGAMMAVAAASQGDRWLPSTPTRLFQSHYILHTSENARHYDVTPDGRRFVMIKPEDPNRPRPIVVVQGFGEELKRTIR